MAGKKQATEIANLQRNLGVSPSATVYVALYTAVPTDTAAGTECADSAYARLAVTWGSITGSPSSISNTNQLDFGIVAGGGYTVVAFAICDALTAGNQVYWNPVTSQALATGNRYQIPIGNLTITED